MSNRNETSKQIYTSLDDLPLFCTVSEVTNILRKSEFWVREKMRTGELPGKKFGGEWRVAKNDLIAYLQGE